MSSASPVTSPPPRTSAPAPEPITYIPLNDVVLQELTEAGLQSTTNFDSLSPSQLRALVDQLEERLDDNNISSADLQSLQLLVNRLNQAADRMASASTGSLADGLKQLQAKRDALMALQTALGNGPTRTSIQNLLVRTNQQITSIQTLVNKINTGIPAWQGGETTQTRDSIVSMLGSITEFETQFGGAIPASLTALKTGLNQALAKFDTAVAGLSTNSNEYKAALSELRITYANLSNTYLQANGASGNDSRVLNNNNVVMSENLWASSQAIDASSVIDSIDDALQRNGIRGITREGMEGHLQNLHVMLTTVRSKMAGANAADQAGWVIAETTLLNRIASVETAIGQLENGDESIFVGAQYISDIFTISAAAYKGFESNARNRITQPGGLNSQLEAARSRGDNNEVQRLQTEINTLTTMADQFDQKHRVLLQMLEQVMRQYSKALDSYADAWRDVGR